MLAWKDTTAALDGAAVAPVRGLVRRSTTAAAFVTQRCAPGPELDPWIEHFWTVDWDLSGEASIDSAVISFPSMHLTAEWGHPSEVRHGLPMPATVVHGVVSRVFHVRLAGVGGVVGARFRPGGFAAWAGVDASRFTDRAVPAGDVLGPDFHAVHTQLTQLEDAETRAETFRQLLVGRAATPRGDLALADLVRRMADDDSLIRVEQLVDRSGWSLRTLQRRFRRGVGIGPKWVLARFRLQEAALALEQDPGVDLAQLAVRLGWYDQAHLTNDFRQMLGETPGQYAGRAHPG